MTAYYTSDLHLGHRFVADTRGYPDPGDHDAAITDHWRRTVHKDDVVFVLGDLAVSRPEPALDLISNLPGRKHLIAGNHDKAHPMHRDAGRWQRVYLGAFESVSPFARRKISGVDVLLSHFPYARDRGEPRYLQYRLRDEGAWLMHGHTHGQEQLSPETRELHVGWDAWGRLVGHDEVAALIVGAV